jgi:hypothetical protein
MSETAINELFGSAGDTGVLDDDAMSAFNIGNIGEEIQTGMGIEVDDVEASEVTLVTIMVDDSGSIRFASNSEPVRQGHNLVIDAFMGVKEAQREGILMHTCYLNGFVLFPYGKVEDAIRMDSSNYDPRMGTPLYDQTEVLLGRVAVKAQEFEDAGIACRTITLIVSDGADMHSHRQTANGIKKIVESMLRTERHIIAGMGVDSGDGVDFRQVFQEMGIPDEWIRTPGDSESDLRKEFQMFSQSAVRASQGAGSFSQTAMGGFGA